MVRKTSAITAVAYEAAETTSSGKVEWTYSAWSYRNYGGYSCPYYYCSTECTDPARVASPAVWSKNNLRNMRVFVRSSRLALTQIENRSTECWRT